jgi:hypothetical protein
LIGEASGVLDGAAVLEIGTSNPGNHPGQNAGAGRGDPTRPARFGSRDDRKRDGYRATGPV